MDQSLFTMETFLFEMLKIKNEMSAEIVSDILLSKIFCLFRQQN